MKSLKIFISVAVILFFSGCQTNHLSPELPDDNDYVYSAYNDNGEVIVTGTLNLIIDDNQINGNWNLKALNNANINQTGPQIGNGTLIGSTQQGHVSINLNPHFYDNNVFLYGIFNNQKISGKWTFSGYGGVMAEGQFIAEKVKLKKIQN